MIKWKERSRPIGQVPIDPLQPKPRWSVWLSGATWVNTNIVLTKWTPGSHGKLGSLSLPISSNCSCVRLITDKIPMCSSVYHLPHAALSHTPSLNWLPMTIPLSPAGCRRGTHVRWPRPRHSPCSQPLSISPNATVDLVKVLNHNYGLLQKSEIGILP
jgi:hypothetical protein